MWKPRGKKDWRPKFWKEDIVLEHSEKVAKRENGKYIIWTRPQAMSDLEDPGKVFILFYTVLRASLFAV